MKIKEEFSIFTREDIYRLAQTFPLVADHGDVIILEYEVPEDNYIAEKEELRTTHNRLQILFCAKYAFRDPHLFYIESASPKGFFMGATLERKMVLRATILFLEQLGRELPPSRFDWKKIKKEVDSFETPSTLYGYDIEKYSFNNPTWIDLAYGGTASHFLLSTYNKKTGYRGHVILRFGRFIVQEMKYIALQEAYENFVEGIKKNRLKTIY